MSGEVWPELRITKLEQSPKLCVKIFRRPLLFFLFHLETDLVNIVGRFEEQSSGICLGHLGPEQYIGQVLVSADD